MSVPDEAGGEEVVVSSSSFMAMDQPTGSNAAREE